VENILRKQGINTSNKKQSLPTLKRQNAMKKQINSSGKPENIQFESVENILRKQGINTSSSRQTVPTLKRQNAMKRTNAGPASAPAAAAASSENIVNPLEASATYALGLAAPSARVTHTARNEPPEGKYDSFMHDDDTPMGATPPPPINGKITITWNGKQETINIKEMNNCDQVTQYLKNNPTTAVIYRMSSAEIAKAKRVEGEGVWFAVICYIDNNGKQINQPITMNDISNTDLYDIIRNKKVVFFTDSLTMQGGKRAKKRSTKKNKRSTRRNRTHRK
jgi:hypothetical protein